MTSSDIAQPSDSDLLTRYQSSLDGTAFAELHKRHDAAIRRFVRSRFGLPDDRIDDISQLTWIDLARSRQNVDSVSGLLKTIARNKAADAMRRSERHVGLSPELEVIDAGGSTLDAIIEGESLSIAQGAVDGLPPGHRLAIECVCDGMTVREAAAKIGVSASTVCKNIRDAMQKIQRAVA